MKKGFTTMEYVVAVILILALAGTLLYAFAPRIEKAPGLVEGFFPEKCISTGLTREQYYSAITDASMAQQFDKAIQLRTAMKACFPDAEVHADIKEYIVEKGIKAIDFAKLDDGTTKSLREAFDKYIETKDLMSPNEFPTIALLLFCRGFYHFKSSSAEGLYLIDIVLERRGITDAQKAEAMALKALFLEREGKLAQALKIYEDIIDKFGKSTSPDVQLYAGLAYLKTNKARDSIPLFTSAASSTSVYNVNLAKIQLAEAQYLSGNTAEAAKLLEPYVAPGADKAIEYAQAVDVYAKVPAKDRTVKDCQLDAVSPVRCVCRFSGKTVILQPEDKQYCCTTGLSSTPCICANVKECKDYPTNVVCNADPCKLRTTKQVIYAQYVENICLWSPDVGACEMKTRGYTQQ
jgi:tetratricopeptide (TPR) repeat protein